MQQGKIRRYLKHGMLPQLRVFEAVARHGSFTRAAEELYLAQPTVSVQIRKLTETVGLPLLEQIGKRIHPTGAGRELYAACQDIFRTLDGVEDAFSDIRGLKAGTLRIATSTSGKYLVPRLLAEFVKLHPGIDVTLHVNHRKAVLDRLDQNADDLYVFSNPPEEEDAVVQRILPNPLVAFAGANHPLARERKIPFERFAREPLLTREPGSGTRMIAERLFARRGLEPLVGMELGSNEAIKEYCSLTYGISFPVLDRIRVNGRKEHPLYTELKKTPDAEGKAGKVQWNFEKFLVTPDREVHRFRPHTEPDAPEVISALESALDAVPKE